MQNRTRELLHGPHEVLSLNPFEFRITVQFINCLDAANEAAGTYDLEASSWAHESPADQALMTEYLSLANNRLSAAWLAYRQAYPSVISSQFMVGSVLTLRRLMAQLAGGPSRDVWEAAGQQVLELFDQAHAAGTLPPWRTMPDETRAAIQRWSAHHLPTA